MIIIKQTSLSTRRRNRFSQQRNFVSFICSVSNASAFPIIKYTHFFFIYFINFVDPLQKSKRAKNLHAVEIKILLSFRAEVEIKIFPASSSIVFFFFSFFVFFFLAKGDWFKKKISKFIGGTKMWSFPSKLNEKGTCRFQTRRKLWVTFSNSRLILIRVTLVWILTFSVRFFPKICACYIFESQHSNVDIFICTFHRPFLHFTVFFFFSLPDYL